jgi:hypothetical protein
MNRPHSRRARIATGRIGRAPTGIARLIERPPVNPPMHTPDDRMDLINRVRGEIQAGIYDTPEKFEAALDRMAARLGND